VLYHQACFINEASQRERIRKHAFKNTRHVPGTMRLESNRFGMVTIYSSKPFSRSDQAAV